MAGTHIIVDGLWKCLCPSVDGAFLLRAINVPWKTIRRRQATRPLYYRYKNLHCKADMAAVANYHAAVAARKALHSDAKSRVGHLSLLASNPGSGAPLADTLLGALGGDGHDNSYAYDEGGEDTPWVRSLLAARPPYKRELEAAPTAAILAALQRLQIAPTAFDRIHAFVRYLVESRLKEPTAVLYESLVWANCHPTGSADAVSKLLQASKDAKIAPSPNLYLGALASLAVHPDYLLRNSILRDMKRRWIEVTPGGKQSEAIGLLRDGQFERAVDLMEQMTGTGTAASGSSPAEAPPPAWFLDIFIYVLGQEGHLDDVMRILNHRLLREGDSISLNVWAFFLGECCRMIHYKGLCFVWSRVVRPGRLTPSDASCIEILSIAAQNQDTGLAAEVMKVMSGRNTKMGLAHFESMLESYASAGLIDRALQALCIMENAGLAPDVGSTRSIFKLLTTPGRVNARTKKRNETREQREEGINDAVEVLFQLKAKYGGVPIAAFDVLLEAILYEGRNASYRRMLLKQASRVPKDSELYRHIEALLQEARAAAEGFEDVDANEDNAGAALDLYRHVRQLCPSGPGQITFVLLLNGCIDTSHLNFLYSEMRALGLYTPTEVSDRIVYENSEYGSLDLAFSCIYDLITRQGGTVTAQAWLSQRTVLSLARRCVSEGDVRIRAVAEIARVGGQPMDALLRDLLGDQPREVLEAYGVDVNQASTDATATATTTTTTTATTTPAVAAAAAAAATAAGMPPAAEQAASATL